MSHFVEPWGCPQQVEIAAHPEVSMRDELARVTGGGPPAAEHLPALEYLDGAVRESLRLRSVVPFVVRKTVQPFSFDGREYPAGRSRRNGRVRCKLDNWPPRLKTLDLFI